MAVTRLRTINRTHCSTDGYYNIDLNHFEVFSPVTNQGFIRKNSIAVNKDPAPCPYNQLAIRRKEKIDQLQQKLNEFELLRLVTDCFKAYCTRDVIPALQDTHPNVELKSWDDCLKKFSSKQIKEAAITTHVSEEVYEALNDLRLKRNALCHTEISSEDIVNLGRKADDFKVFESGIMGGPNYVNAALRLSRALRNLPQQNAAPQADSTLTNYL